MTTRNELRAQAIAAMIEAVPDAVKKMLADWWLDEIITDVFDALHGIVRVVSMDRPEPGYMDMRYEKAIRINDLTNGPKNDS